MEVFQLWLQRPLFSLGKKPAKNWGLILQNILEEPSSQFRSHLNLSDQQLLKLERLLLPRHLLNRLLQKWKWSLHRHPPPPNQKGSKPDPKMVALMEHRIQRRSCTPSRKHDLQKIVLKSSHRWLKEKWRSLLQHSLIN